MKTSEKIVKMGDGLGLSSFNLSNLPKIKRHSKKRLGRGIGSGKGKTSGRGVKGQKARTGSSIKGFEGGQTPIYMRLPKRGFKSYRSQDIEIITIDNVYKAIEKNGFDNTKSITKAILCEFGLIKDQSASVKLLMGKKSHDSSVKKVKIEVDFYSEKAKDFT